MVSPSLRACPLYRVRLFATLWTVARQVPLPVEFSRQEYWSGLSFPPPGDLPDQGVEPASLTSPALAGGFFTGWVTGILFSSPLASRLTKEEIWSSTAQFQACVNQTGSLSSFSLPLNITDFGSFSQPLAREVQVNASPLTIFVYKPLTTNACYYSSSSPSYVRRMKELNFSHQKTFTFLFYLNRCTSPPLSVSNSSFCPKAINHLTIFSWKPAAAVAYHLSSQLIGKEPDAGKDWRQKEKGWQRMRWPDSITNAAGINLSKLWETVEDRGVWPAAAHEVAKS